ADKIVTAAHIRELQPGIVINPRLHGSGDYVTYERTLPISEKATGWAEFCNTWTNNWSYVPQPFRANGFVLGQLARIRSLGLNYLLGIGPMPNGELEPAAYSNMAVVAEWMKTDAVAIKEARPLADNETASVPATSAGSTRYLFLLPPFRNNGAYDKDLQPAANETVTLSGVSPASKGQV